MTDTTVYLANAMAALIGAAPLLVAPAMAGEPSSQSAVAADAVYERPADVRATEPKLTPRPEPLRDFPVEQVLDVTDFGAVPDDEANDVAAIRAAMKRAAEATVPTEVRFPKGRYYLDADIETDEYAKITNDALAMARARRVILNGNGSEIIIRTPPTGFLALYACEDVIVRDLVVDWDPPPFAQGFVRAVDRKAGTFDFEVEPGYLSMDHPLWQRPNRKGYDSIRWGMLKDPNIPGRMKFDVPNVYFCDAWDKVGERTFRMKLRNPGQAAHVEVGDRYVHVDRNGGINLGCTKNAIIRDNRLLADPDAPGGIDGEPHVPIRIFNAARVSVHDNHIEDQRQLAPRPIEVADDCDDVDVRGSTLHRRQAE